MFGHAKVDDVNRVGSLSSGAANEEIIRLDVAVDKVLLVDRLDPCELEVTKGEVSAFEQEERKQRGG